jgi:hypothetical protein
VSSERGTSWNLLFDPKTTTIVLKGSSRRKLVISEKKQQAIIGMVIEALIDPVPGFECYGLVT